MELPRINKDITTRQAAERNQAFPNEWYDCPVAGAAAGPTPRSLERYEGTSLRRRRMGWEHRVASELRSRSTRPGKKTRPPFPASSAPRTVVCVHGWPPRWGEARWWRRVVEAVGQHRSKP